MLQLFPEFTEQIRSEAISAFPNEAAWVITQAGCRQVENVADDPTNFFDIAPIDVARAQAEGLLAIVHSHVNGQHYPSEMDMRYQVASNVPWGLLTTDGVGASALCWWGGKTIEQTEDLEHRPFRHGTSDCFALVRDYYRVKLGIELQDVPRKWRWWEDQNIIEEHIEPLGFFVVKGDPKPGDVWLASFSSQSNVMNHCGVLVDNDLTLHHPGANEPVSDMKKAAFMPIYRYLPYIRKWIRHKDMAHENLSPTRPGG